MSDEPMAKPACEHYWAYHCHGGLSVRLCQLCHEPDWDAVRGEREEGERKGEMAGRAEGLRQLGADLDSDAAALDTMGDLGEIPWAAMLGARIADAGSAVAILRRDAQLARDRAESPSAPLNVPGPAAARVTPPAAPQRAVRAGNGNSSTEGER